MKKHLIIKKNDIKLSIMSITEISDIFMILKDDDNVRHINFIQQQTLEECGLTIDDLY